MKTDIEDFDIVSSKGKASFDEGLESIMKNVMQLSLDNPIPLAISYHAGVSTWHQFMYIDEVDIYDAKYQDNNGSVKVLTAYEQKLLQWLIGYVRENIDTHKPGSDLPSFYTKDGFTEYTQSRRKLYRFKSRYRGTSAEKKREQDERRKSIEEHIVEFATKVKKATTDILEKHKEKMKNEKVSGTTGQNENENRAANE